MPILPPPSATGSRSNDLSSTLLSSASIQQLVDDGQLLRILQPALIDQLQRKIQENEVAHTAVICHQGQVYLSLQALSPRERETAHALIQRLQLGEAVDLARLPISLRPLLQPGKRQTGRFVWILMVSMLLGIVSGVLGMAIGVLILGALGVAASGTSGLQLTAVIFILATVIGWLFFTLMFSHRNRTQIDPNKQ